jgi:hypothetical protein
MKPTPKEWLLLIIIFLSIILLSACNSEEVEEKVVKQAEVVFVSPEPHNTPQQISERLRDASSAPQLSSTHMSEDLTLCFECHPKEKLYTRDQNLIFNHQRHFKKDIVCHTCHHNEGAVVYIPVKEDCIACHTEAGIPTSCKTCHKDTEILMPDSHKGGDFEHLHGKMGLDLTTCSGCHGQKRFCIDCHGVEMPHPDDYSLIHPSQVQGDPQRCVLCHGEQSCEKCHSKRGVKFD